MANNKVIENADKQALEITLLIQAIKACYHIDFSHYKQASFKRRLMYNVEKNNLSDISQLIPKLIWSYSFFEQLLFDISIPVTEMYRDPLFYAELNNRIIPFLTTFPYAKIWIAGCATGEEAYSLAILLHESNILEHFKIIATDFNHQALEIAKLARYELSTFKNAEINYKKAGGKTNLSQYFIKKDTYLELIPEIKEKVEFLAHDLTSNHVLTNIHLILCRNVFIYFDRVLQTHAASLFYDSLCTGGFLGMGLKESLDFIPNHGFEDYAPKVRIYKKSYK